MHTKMHHTGNGDIENNDTAVSQALLPEYDTLAKEITDRKQKAFQELISQHDIEWSKLLEYTHYDLSSLTNALTSSSPEVFKEYIAGLQLSSRARTFLLIY